MAHWRRNVTATQQPFAAIIKFQATDWQSQYFCAQHHKLPRIFVFAQQSECWYYIFGKATGVGITHFGVTYQPELPTAITSRLFIAPIIR